MPPSESRSDKRKERYRELRALGFSPAESRRLRDRSGENIQVSISKEQRRISRKPVGMRTASEEFKLRRIQQRNRAANQIQQQSRMDSRESRWRKFSDYSKSGIWPADFRKRIREINSRAGLTPDDGYGYRRFYYEYVERLPIEESIELADRSDSEVRYLLNKPLVPGRVNLRRKINPPKPQSEVA